MVERHRFNVTPFARKVVEGRVPCWLWLKRPAAGPWWFALAMIAAAVVVAVAVPVAQAAEFLARPEIPGYPTPSSTFPPPRRLVYEYLDVVALVVALALASWFALRLRWRRGLFLLTVASLLWFGFWRRGCVCSIGSIQNITHALADPSYVLPLTVVAFFVLPLFFTLFFGRTFCAAVCPLGAIQELAALRPVKVPQWLEHALGLIPYVYLGLAVVLAALGGGYVICQYDPYVGFFRRAGNANMMILGLCLLLVGIFVGRPYCRYLCPLGALLRLCSRVSRWHVRIAPEECIRCRLCEDVCPYNAIRQPTVEQSPAERRGAKRRLAISLLALPVWIGLGYWAGGQLGVPLARMHPEFRLAERVRLEEAGRAEGTTEASEAFWNSGRSVASLYAEAGRLRSRFAFGGRLLGAWVGVVVALKLVALCLRRRRDEYVADRAACVSCGRCFWYCPGEQVRLGLITVEEFESRRQTFHTSAPEKRRQ